MVKFDVTIQVPKLKIGLVYRGIRKVLGERVAAQNKQRARTGEGLKWKPGRIGESIAFDTSRGTGIVHPVGQHPDRPKMAMAQIADNQANRGLGALLTVTVNDLTELDAILEDEVHRQFYESGELTLTDGDEVLILRK